MDDSTVLAGLTSLTRDMNKEVGEGSCLPGDKPNLSDIGRIRIPSTSFMLNLLLGGGVPLGRVIELVGDPSHGKSTLVQHMMCGFQQYPGISVLIDSEAGWSRERAMLMGHNPSRHIHLQTDTMESSFSAINSLITRVRMPGSKFPPDMPVGIFYDTISASQTEGIKTGDIYKDGMADVARKLRVSMKALALKLAQTNCAFIAVNHLTTTGFGSRRGPSKDSGGGTAVKYWAAKRIKVWRSGILHYPKKNSGIIVNVENFKDKLNCPFQQVILPMMYKTGVHPFYEVLNFLADNSTYVNVAGGRFTIPEYPETGEDLKLGYQKTAYQKLEKHPELIDHLRLWAEETWNA